MKIALNREDGHFYVTDTGVDMGDYLEVTPLDNPVEVQWHYECFVHVTCSCQSEPFYAHLVYDAIDQVTGLRKDVPVSLTAHKKSHFHMRVTCLT